MTISEDIEALEKALAAGPNLSERADAAEARLSQVIRDLEAASTLQVEFGARLSQALDLLDVSIKDAALLQPNPAHWKAVDAFLKENGR